MQLGTLQLNDKSITLDPGLPLLIGTVEGGRSVQASDQIAQAFAAGDLRVGHADEIAPRGELACSVVRAMLVVEVLKVLEGHHCEQLREYRAAGIHWPATTNRYA
jgi:hypothetical protein